MFPARVVPGSYVQYDERIVCNFGRVRELSKSPHSKEPDSGPRNIRKKSGAPRWKGHVEP